MDKCAEVVHADAGGEAPHDLLISKQEHGRVMASIVDVPACRPSFPIKLDQVGITNKTVWIHFKEMGHLPFIAELSVNLGGERRGIHMSRMEQAISTLHSQCFSDPGEYALLLAQDIMLGQEAKQARVRLSGQLPFPTQTRVSRLLSLDTLKTTVTADLAGQQETMSKRLACGVEIYHMTACPCTQVYNQALFMPSRQSGPPATHSQRSKTRLVIETDAQPYPSSLEIAQCLGAALHSAQDLLKRPDEAELVLQAHLSPQFAEDAVREVARQTAIRFGPRLPADTRITIESLSLESIHIHDVSCRLTTSLGEILAIKTAPEQTIRP